MLFQIDFAADKNISHNHFLESTDESCVLCVGLVLSRFSHVSKRVSGEARLTSYLQVPPMLAVLAPARDRTTSGILKTQTPRFLETFLEKKNCQVFLCPTPKVCTAAFPGAGDSGD